MTFGEVDDGVSGGEGDHITDENDVEGDDGEGGGAKEWYNYMEGAWLKKTRRMTMTATMKAI